MQNYHAGRKEWISDIRWYHYVVHYTFMACKLDGTDGQLKMKRRHTNA